MNAVVVSAARAGKRSARPSRSRQAGRRAVFGFSALLFAASATGTVLWCASMSDMGGMPMPGAWTMSMLWMRMPGETWPSVGAAFLGMWTVMMVAMMLPSLVPALWRSVEAASRPGRLAALVGAGYLCVWIALGVGVFLLGIVLAALEMQEPELARAVPMMAGIVVLGAGALQFTAWKAHHLALCRQVTCPSENAAAALRWGVRLGLHCSLSSAGLTAILLVLGMMDLRTMAAVTAAITVERLAPAGKLVAHATGTVAAVAGLILVISAA
jgi:predicted metal-binding membrane protein